MICHSASGLRVIRPPVGKQAMHRVVREAGDRLCSGTMQRSAVGCT